MVSHTTAYRLRCNIEGPGGPLVDHAPVGLGYVVRVDSDGSRTRVAQGFDFRQARARRAPIPMVVDDGGNLVVALPGDGSMVRIRP